MACVGRTKECTIVPSNHYGPVPGVEVGTMWKFRVQVWMLFIYFFYYFFALKCQDKLKLLTLAAKKVAGLDILRAYCMW